ARWAGYSTSGASASMKAIKVAAVSFRFPPQYSGYGNQLHAVTESIVEQASDSVEFVVLTGVNSGTRVPQSVAHVVRLVPNFFARLGLWATFYTFVGVLAVWLLAYRSKYDVIHCVKAG